MAAKEKGNIIDRANRSIGSVVGWMTFAMVLVGAFNAIVRFLDRYTGLGLSSNTYIELQWYLFALVFLLGAAYTLQVDRHVRVDVLYSRLSDRGKRRLNLAGIALFLLPFCALMIWASIPGVRNSWSILETSPDPGGLPRYPIKTIIPIAFVLVALQGLSIGAKLLRSPESDTPNPDDTS